MEYLEFDMIKECKLKGESRPKYSNDSLIKIKNVER